MTGFKQALIVVILLLGFCIMPLPHAYGSKFTTISSSGTIVETLPVQYELIVEVSGSGSTDPSPGSYMYEEDALVPVDALPSAGWRLNYWLLDGVNVGSADPYTVTMDSNHNLTAVFVIETDHSKLYVDGIVIKDSSGNPVRLQGFNVETLDLNENLAQWMQAKGFNYVRAFCFWNQLEGGSTRPSSMDSRYLNPLDDFLQPPNSLAQRYGIYVNFCFGQWHWSPYFTDSGTGVGFPRWVVSPGGYPNSQSGRSQCMMDFYMERNAHGVWMKERFWEYWDFIINRYKDNPYLIAYEPMNEPTIGGSGWVTGSREAIMDMFETFTGRVRAIDPDTIHVYHDIEARQERYERAVSYPNIVWTRSLYPAYDATVEVDELKQKYNTNIGTPFIISEIGIQSTSSSNLQAVRDRLDRCRSVQLNDGYECFAWYLYHVGTPHRGYVTPRNSNGSDTAIVSVLQDYL